MKNKNINIVQYQEIFSVKRNKVTFGTCTAQGLRSKMFITLSLHSDTTEQNRQPKHFKIDRSTRLSTRSDK